MTTGVSLRAGHDVRYFTAGSGCGCAGVMSYYTRGGEPPGRWAGRAAEGLGLSGEVDPEVVARLFQEGVGPGGEVLARRKAGGKDAAEVRAAVAAYRKAHPYASAAEVGEFRVVQRAKAGQHTVPYFDFTVSAAKSVSVLHASLRVGAMQARASGDAARGADLDARADAVEQALMDAAAELVGWLEQHATYTRTGHHSASTGEWRDGAGLAAARFLHHVSRDGDPHLHVHVAVWNRVQRADGADGKWRALYGRMLFQQRLGLWPVPDRLVEQKLRDLGYWMVPRADGNGCEVGGVSPEVMARFSSRAVQVTDAMRDLVAEYERVHGKPPDRRTLWLLHQQAGQRTRRPKGEAVRTVAGRVGDAELTASERLAAWEAATAADEMRALSSVHEDAARFAVKARQGPHLVMRRDDAALASTARVAVAEVQKHHAAWTRAQLRYEVHRALGAGASPELVDEIEALAVSGRAGTECVQVGAAPDVADVAPLGVRGSDGVSVYRPPGEERWCTTGHLDLEERVVEQAKRPVEPRVAVADAKAAVAGTDLNAEQAAAVEAWLTAGVASVPLNAAAGSGKSHAVAVFAELWARLTGGRVVGLTTSTNAARVLEGEGVPEAYNIAEFLGKTPGSDELRRPVRVGPGDVLVVDEATQVSTADLVLVQEAGRVAGAQVHPVGDTAQLGAVEAGGAFALLTGEVPTVRLSEVRRFRYVWERDASLRLRDGDVGAVAAYDRRGRVQAGDHEVVFDRAAAAWLSDHLRGRESLLLAGSNDEAADLSRRVQARLAAMRRVGPGHLVLADGNLAGQGDLVRARLNTHIDAGGRRLTNRDTLQVAGVDGDDVVARRRVGPGQWSAQFRVPVAYLASSAELDYAGNVHVAQGRTVDAGHLVVTPSLSRQSFYVGMTRGREENTAHVETGASAPPGKPAFEQATPESVIRGVMERDSAELSATAQLRAGQEWAAGAGHVLHLWSVAVRERLVPSVDAMVRGRVSGEQYARYVREHAREVFHARLREAMLAGHDVAELVERVTRDSLDGARSVASVLHSRLAGLGLGQSAGVSWSARTPAGTGLAAELAAGLDRRAAELGERLAARPEPWLLRHLGVPPREAGGVREDWVRRAGAAGLYREAAGITHPEQDVSAGPHAGDPELETARRAAMAALEVTDEAERLASMGRGELEAVVARGDRARAVAPPDVTGEARLTGQARGLAWAQSAEARAAGDEVAAVDAAETARALEVESARLEPEVARYEAWSAVTAADREAAGKAQAELTRRGQDWPEPGESLAQWWVDLDRDLDAAGRALGAERAAAEAAGSPWPPVRPPAPEPGGGVHPEAVAVIDRLTADGFFDPGRGTLGVEAAATAGDEGQGPPPPSPGSGQVAPQSVAGPAGGNGSPLAAESGPEAVGGDTPPGSGYAPAVVAAPDAGNQGDPRAAGAGEAGASASAARGAQPVPAASPEPELDEDPEPDRSEPDALPAGHPDTSEPELVSDETPGPAPEPAGDGPDVDGLMVALHDAVGRYKDAEAARDAEADYWARVDAAAEASVDGPDAEVDMDW